MFVCMECGKKFATTKAAERASINGCPRCNGVDIDLDLSPAKPKPSTKVQKSVGKVQ